MRVDQHLAMVAVVGRAMKNMPGMSGRILSELGAKQINIRTITQSCDELSIVIGVDNRDFSKAIQAIYNKFINEERQGLS